MKLKPHTIAVNGRSSLWQNGSDENRVWYLIPPPVACCTAGWHFLSKKQETRMLSGGSFVLVLIIVRKGVKESKQSTQSLSQFLPAAGEQGQPPPPACGVHAGVHITARPRVCCAGAGADA